jgi:hypothetical protein
MKNFLKLLSVAALATVVGFASFADASTGKVNTTVEVEILPGDVCIGATGAFDFGDYTVSSSLQTVTGAFTDYFWVDDLKGADSGYYTTLQLSGDLVGPGGATIPAANVFTNVTTTGTTLVTGSANANVVVADGLAAWSALDSAQTFIKRDTGTNNGLLGQYGSLPQLRVDIPAYQAVGTYTATLCYTLYEN